MKTAFGLLLFLVAGLTITSCQREIDGDFPSPDPSSFRDSTYISLYVEVDTSYPAGSDTAFKHTFKYDAQKRVTEIVEYNYQTGSPLFDHIYIEKYLYNGMDTVPARYVITDYDGAGNEFTTDSVFLKYNADNIITEDSVRRVDNGIVSVYVSKFIRQSDNKYKVIVSGDSYRYDSAIVTNTFTGNMITERTEEYVGGIITTTSEYKTTVDTKLNPFYRIGLKYPVNEFISGGYFTWNEKNNPVELEYSGPFSSYRYLASYEYRADGQPLIYRLKSATDPDDFTKGFYYYTKL